MKFKLTVWGALAFAACLESLRRKDLWVSVILAVLMISAAALIGKFGVAGLEMFLKDVTLTVVNLLSMVLAVLFAARQLPEEISRRTVYPLLARPITRFDLIFGKYLGAVSLSTFALLLFALIGWGALACFGLKVGTIFGQYLWLRFLSLLLICAVTMALSVFLTPQATVTMVLLLAAGSSTFATTVKLLHGTAGTIGQGLLSGAYFVLPQLDLFDLSKKVSYGWSPVMASTMLFLLGYALVHSAICLALGTLRFRKQAL
jgi:ABC-type transport system involved in multi-copper enzyme maturation permease subunit